MHALTKLITCHFPNCGAPTSQDSIHDRQGCIIDTKAILVKSSSFARRSIPYLLIRTGHNVIRCKNCTSIDENFKGIAVISSLTNLL